MFLRQGFHATTVDRIAEEAGFTKGAVYSTFQSKAELFLALYEESARKRAAQYLRDAEGKGSEEQIRALIAEWMGVLRRDRDWSSVLIEFWAFAARDDALRRRFADVHGSVRKAIAEAIETSAARSSRKLAAPPEVLAMASMAISNGFTLESFANPALVQGDTYETIALLLGRAFISPDTATDSLASSDGETPKADEYAGTKQTSHVPRP